MRARELLLKIMAVLAKVSTLRERLPSVLVDSCLYYCCTAHQALAALRSLCTEGCARTVRSTCVGVRNVIREFILTAATVLFAQVRTGYFDAYCTCVLTGRASRSAPSAKCQRLASSGTELSPASRCTLGRVGRLYEQIQQDLCLGVTPHRKELIDYTSGVTGATVLGHR